jgi:hypothetical protein
VVKIVNGFNANKVMSVARHECCMLSVIISSLLQIVIFDVKW